ncbi:MAG TPA: hypothetical protein VGT00_05870 [Methylomirabilota bacterium]|jgi:hypothetical protein|nr:hypothetical protein [Methylomirabilota bacterium]
MIRLLGAAVAVVLSAAPVLIMPVQAVAVIALVGLLLATVGVAAFWRWPVTAAACVFLADYAAALWGAAGPVNVAGAAGFGLALLFMLESADLARRVRRAAVDGAVIRSHLGRWSGFGAATLGSAALAVALASALATPIPAAIAPLLAAGGALGVITTIAVIITRVTLNRRSAGR